jgi:cyclopropane-fatty-acyl-phospholipid synthase
MSSREQNMMVMQIQLAKRQGVVPITREYISSEERRRAAAEGKRKPPPVNRFT